MTLLDYHRLHGEERDSWDLAAVEAAASRQDAAFASRVQECLPASEEKFSGNLVQVERGPLFEKLARLCRLYLQGSPEQRTYIRSRVDRRIGSKLESFALRAAVWGVREQAPDLVRLGLAAFAIADIGGDVRETLMSMAVLFHAANRCGAGAATLFPEAAGICGPAMSAVLLDFLQRAPGLQSLASMGWREVETPEGAGFEWGWPKRGARQE